MILFTLLIGYRIPLPGIDVQYLQLMFGELDGTSLGGFLNAITGNSFANMSLFALSITPYISASILVQLLCVVIPPLERMQKDGSVGRQKLDKLVFVVGAVIAAISSLSMALTFGKQGLFMEYTWYMVLFATVVWTGGACFLIWVGQTITKKLIGNGISFILLFNILTTFPTEVISIFQSLSNSLSWWVQILIGLSMTLVFALIFAYVVVMNTAEKRLQISNSGKMGMRMKGANTNILPLKVNMGGVMPIIFTSSVMSIPSLLSAFFTVNEDSLWYKFIQCFNQSNWFDLENPIYTLGVLIFIPITFLFSYLYAKISFNPNDIADSLRQSGSVINGIRPGQPTADYLKRQVKSVLWIGTAMLIVISLIPTLVSGLCNLGGLSFSGNTIIIIVGSILEIKNIIYAQTSSVAYDSLIKKKGAKK